MVSLAIALVIAFSVGTVQVADYSRPGDPFFGIDQAVENVRLKMATEKKAEELRLKFAEERLKEIETLPPEEQARLRAGVESALELMAGIPTEDTVTPEAQAVLEELKAYVELETKLETEN